MKKFKQRILAVALTLVMIMSLIPVLPISAEEEQSGMTFTADTQYQLEKSLTQMPRTIEAWVKLDASYTARAGGIIGNYNSGKPNFVLEINTKGNPRLYMQTDSGVIDVKFNEVNVCTGEYVHLAVVIRDVEGDVGTVECYINGELKQTKTPQYAIPKDMTVSAPLIGGDLRDSMANTQYFKGELKGVALYEDARTVEEIKADMTALSLEGLMAAWDLTGQQGAQTLKDISGNGYDASLPMTFTQTDMYQVVKSFPSMPRTIETWVKFSSDYAARSGSVIGNYNSGRPNFTLEFNASGKPRLFMQDVSGSADINLVFSEVPSVYTGKWVHVAITIDDAAGKVHCYINGELKQSMEATIPAAITTSGAVIGGDLRDNLANTQYFKGEMRSVTVYTDLRSAEEIAADMVEPGSEDLMAHWITAGNVGENTIYDESGNGYHATLMNMKTESAEGGLTFSSDELYRTEKALTVMPHTFEAEVYLPANMASSQRGGVIVGNYGQGDVCFNLEIFTGGHPRFYAEYEGTEVLNCVFDEVDLRTGTWTHLAVVINDETGTVDCYVNGYLEQSKEMVVPDAVSSNVVALGGDLRSGNQRYFLGSIKSVALFADARTASEIKADMNGMSSILLDDLLVLWNTEELESPDEIADDSGNGYTVKRYKTWFSDKEAVTDYSYSMVVVGDTQKVTYDDVTNGNANLTKIYDWILANQESKNIQYVLGMGDITDANIEEEWTLAYNTITKLDGKIGYSLVRGNHDGSAMMNQTFNKTNYTSTYEGSFDDDIEDTWRTLTVGDVKYLIMTLDYGANDAVLKWASQVIEEHPDHNVIITTHAYLYRDGTTLDSGDVCPPSTSGGSNDGDDLWDKLISKHSNIVLVLSGHDPCDRVVMTQTTGEHGNVVTQLLVDPQGVDAAQGSTGMITVLYFSEDGKNVQVETYSTVKEQYFMTENQFTFTLDTVEDTDDTSQAEKPTVPTTVEFSSAEEAWEAFELYQSTSGGFVVRDGKLVPSGVAGEFKAIYKDNGSPISSVSVDIYPNGAAGLINGGLYIGASGAGHKVDEINALTVIVESVCSGWEDAPNRVDLIVGGFPVWQEFSRLISETGANNALFSGGYKEPLRLKVAIKDNVLTITLSLISDPSKQISTTYVYTGDGDLSLGDVGIRSAFNDAKYDNFTVEYADVSDPEPDPEPNPEPNPDPEPEPDPDPEGVLTETITFEDHHSSIFDFYHSSEGGFAVQDGRLVPTGESGEFKAIVKGTEKIYSAAVTIYPGSFDTINSGIYIDVSNPDHPVDAIDAIAVFVQADFSGWDDAANRVDLVIGAFPTWQELGRVISETGAGNALFTGGVKEPVRLEVTIENNVLTAKLSLVSDPDRFISTTYIYTGEGDISLGDVGLRSAFNNATFDNFTLKYLPTDGSIIPEPPTPDQDPDTDPDTDPDEPTDPVEPEQEPTDVVDFEEASDSDKFDFYTSSNGGFVIVDGKLVPTGEEGEFKAIYKDKDAKFSAVSVDIYPGENGINSGIYLNVSTVDHGVDKIKALAVFVESNMSGWDDAVNRIDLVVGSFPIWKELSRYTSETGANNALFSGEKEPVNLKVELDGNKLTITLSLLSDPTKFVTTTYEYTGEGDISLGNVGLRSAFNDSSFDNFSVTYTTESVPDTGDHNGVVAALAAMLMSAACAAVVIRKKEEE